MDYATCVSGVSILNIFHFGIMSRGMMGVEKIIPNWYDMVMDTPLKRWRRQARMTQADLAALCEVRQGTIARWEGGTQIPRGARLWRLMLVTQLPVEAIVLPRQFLEEHPYYPGV